MLQEDESANKENKLAKANVQIRDIETKERPHNKKHFSNGRKNKINYTVVDEPEEQTGPHYPHPSMMNHGVYHPSFFHH